MEKRRSAFIVDNRETDLTDKVQGYLEKWCDVSRQFDIATGYFEIGSLSRLDGEWQKLDKIRILMGDEVSKRTKKALVEAITKKLDTSFDEEKEKHGNEFLKGIPAIIEGITSGKIECRVYTRKKFHAKVYITHTKHDIMGPVALVGSSNFTVPGISQNIEMNVRIETGHQVDELQSWFEEFWNDAEEINEDILKTMETHAREYEPFLLYGKSLEEYFRSRSSVGAVDEWHRGNIEEGGSIIWKDLDKYQKDGYQSLMEIGEDWQGAFLCDGVGLGKTYQGLMLIERLAGYEGKNVLLLAPKAIHDSVWEPQINEKLPNLAGWASNLKHMAHTDLTKDSYEEQWKIAQERFDAIIIDEAHHFRNRLNNQKYQILKDLINKGRTKNVYFLTATPINNSIHDLRNMINLFTNDNVGHFNKIGVYNTDSHFKKLKQQINLTSRNMDNTNNDIDAELMSNNDVINEFKRDKLVRALVVQRSRNFVQKSQKIDGGRNIDFPEPQDPKVWSYNLKEVYGDFLEEFINSFGEDDELLSLSFYYPYKYYRHEPQDEKTRFERARLKQIGQLIRIGFLKSFESSIRSFEWRCNRLLLKVISWLKEHQLDDDKLTKRLDGWLEKNKTTVRHSRTFSNKNNDSYGEDDDDEDWPDVSKNIWNDDDFDVRAIIEDTYTDLELLTKFSEKLSNLDVEDDDKLNKLIELIKTDAKSNTNKIIIFSEFTKTTEYLHQQLTKKLAGYRIAKVDGTSGTDKKEFVKRFSPYYNNSSSIEQGENEIDILISSDVLAEGLNLQDSSSLINYDIHWNPVRLMQRIGRIDRRMNPKIEKQIVKNHPDRADERGKINYWNFLPPNEIDNVLRLYNRVSHKILSISLVFGIEKGKVLTADDDYKGLEVFNANRIGETSDDEDLKLELENLQKKYPELHAKWRKLPFHVISGKKNQTGQKGLFFCYRIPGEEKLSEEDIKNNVEPNWSTKDGVGESQWFFYDFETEEIAYEIKDMPKMHEIVKCEPDDERILNYEHNVLKNVKKKVLKHINNKSMKYLQVPAKQNGVPILPRLVCWMEIN